MKNERAQVRKLLSELNEQRPRLFPLSRERLAVPNTQGVYIIRNADEEVMHVGRSVRGKGGLFQRLRNHLRGQSSFARACLKGNGSKLRSGFTFQYLEVPDDRERALLEHCATAWHCPCYLGLGAKRTGHRK